MAPLDKYYNKTRKLYYNKTRKLYYCSACEKAFPQADNLRSHILSAPQHFFCFRHERNFGSAEAVENHYDDHPEHWFCALNGGDKCKFDAVSFENLCKHWDSNRCYEYCRTCKTGRYAWLTKIQHGLHRLERHAVTETVQKPPQVKTVSCMFCPSHFKDKQALEQVRQVQCLMKRSVLTSAMNHQHRQAVHNKTAAHQPKTESPAKTSTSQARSPKKDQGSLATKAHQPIPAEKMPGQPASSTRTNQAAFPTVEQFVSTIHIQGLSPEESRLGFYNEGHTPKETTKQPATATNTEHSSSSSTHSLSSATTSPSMPVDGRRTSTAGSSEPTAREWNMQDLVLEKRPSGQTQISSRALTPNASLPTNSAPQSSATRSRFGGSARSSFSVSQNSGQSAAERRNPHPVCLSYPRVDAATSRESRKINARASKPVPGDDLDEGALKISAWLASKRAQQAPTHPPGPTAVFVDPATEVHSTNVEPVGKSAARHNENPPGDSTVQPQSQERVEPGRSRIRIKLPVPADPSKAQGDPGDAKGNAREDLLETKDKENQRQMSQENQQETTSLAGGPGSKDVSASEAPDLLADWEDPDAAIPTSKGQARAATTDVGPKGEAKSSVPCWTSCGKAFPSIAAVLGHIEQGECSSKTSAIDLYKIAMSCDSFYLFIYGRFHMDMDKGKDLKVKYLGNVWPFFCPKSPCEEVFRSLSDLIKHVEATECKAEQKMKEGVIQELMGSLKYYSQNGLL